eukprot:scaffold214655_cov24-Tisochrysis_lutea.AAC.1
MCLAPFIPLFKWPSTGGAAWRRPFRWPGPRAARPAGSGGRKQDGKMGSALAPLCISHPISLLPLLSSHSKVGVGVLYSRVPSLDSYST